MIADIFPSDSAVKEAEENILNPENKKLYLNIRNPVAVIRKISVSFVVKSCINEFFSIIESRKINIELNVTKDIHIL